MIWRAVMIMLWPCWRMTITTFTTPSTNVHSRHLGQRRSRWISIKLTLAHFSCLLGSLIQSEQFTCTLYYIKENVWFYFYNFLNEIYYLVFSRDDNSCLTLHSISVNMERPSFPNHIYHDLYHVIWKFQDFLHLLFLRNNKQILYHIANNY